jgi:hypothetical protein
MKIMFSGIIFQSQCRVLQPHGVKIGLTQNENSVLNNRRCVWSFSMALAIAIFKEAPFWKEDTSNVKIPG